MDKLGHSANILYEDSDTCAGQLVLFVSVTHAVLSVPLRTLMAEAIICPLFKAALNCALSKGVAQGVGVGVGIGVGIGVGVGHTVVHSLHPVHDEYDPFQALSMVDADRGNKNTITENSVIVDIIITFGFFIMFVMFIVLFF